MNCQRSGGIMKIKNKTLLITGILCLVGILINILDIYLDIKLYSSNLFYLIMDSISCCISLASGIFLIVMAMKSDEYVAKRANIFFIFSLINILNNIIVWAIVLWAQFAVSARIRKHAFESYTRAFRQENDGSITLEKDEYEITRLTENLTEELNALNKKKEDGTIDEREYNKQREEIIKKYILSNKDNKDEKNA